MPQQAQPWYRTGRGWYIELNRKQIFLAKDRNDAFKALPIGFASRDEAWADMCWAFSSVPPLRIYSVMPVAETVAADMGERPAAKALRFTIRRASLRCTAPSRSTRP